MPVTVTDMDILREYMEGVMKRANHHALAIRGTVLALCGGVAWRHDLGSISARTYAGHTVNVLTFKVGGRPYYFRYEHSTGQVELRDGNNRLVHSMEDATHTSTAIYKIIEAL